MTPQQVDLVEHTLALVRDRLPALSAAFYRRLFELDPALASMFSADPDAQAQRFGRELDSLVALIRRHPDFLVAARSLGERHRGYGVRPSHFRTAEQALVGALGAELGSRWTTEAADAWRLAYNLTTEAMLASS